MLYTHRFQHRILTFTLTDLRGLKSIPLQKYDMKLQSNRQSWGDSWPFQCELSRCTGSVCAGVCGRPSGCSSSDCTFQVDALCVCVCHDTLIWALCCEAPQAQSRLAQGGDPVVTGKLDTGRVCCWPAAETGQATLQTPAPPVHTACLTKRTFSSAPRAMQRQLLLMKEPHWHVYLPWPCLRGHTTGPSPLGQGHDWHREGITAAHSDIWHVDHWWAHTYGASHGGNTAFALIPLQISEHTQCRPKNTCSHDIIVIPDIPPILIMTLMFYGSDYSSHAKT